MLFDISLSNIFGGYVSLGNENKSKNNQMGLHQTKSFCIPKETINKTKRQQPTKWEGLIYKLYKELIQLNIRKPNNQK